MAHLAKSATNGGMIYITRRQREGLKRLYDHFQPPVSYRQYRRSVRMDSWGAAMVNLGNMWIGVESDGYAHS